MVKPVVQPRKRRTPKVWLTLIFVSGIVVGGVGGSLVTQHRMLAMLRSPAQVPDRIMPQIRSRLRLDAKQAAQVEEIVRQRYANIESLRAEVYPEQREEFSAMHDDVAPLLDEQQKVAWNALCQTVEERYLPRKPAGPPIDLIFWRFDANDDNILSQEEVPPRMWLRLSMADEDGNGNVTPVSYTHLTLPTKA